MEEQNVNMEDVKKNKMMAIVAYFLFFVPLLTDAKTSPFARFHANQGLNLLIFSVVVNIVAGFLAFIPFIGLIVYVATLALLVIGVMNANKGEMKKLPVIGGVFNFIK